MAESMDRHELLDEIDDVIELGLMGKEQLLDALLRSMETPEIRENWEYIKRCHELDTKLYGEYDPDNKLAEELFV